MSKKGDLARLGRPFFRLKSISYKELTLILECAIIILCKKIPIPLIEPRKFLKVSV